MLLTALKKLVIVTIFLSATAIHSLPVTTTSQPSKTQSPADANGATTHAVNQGDAYEYLKRFGYVGKNSQSDEGPASMTDLSGPLKKLQHFAGLDETGELDDATIKLMNTPRCDVPDIGEADSDFAKRFTTAGKWWKKKLTYRIDGYPTNSYDLQDPALVDEVIATSFKDWSDVADISFTKTSENSDINVNFVSGDHGDGWPFDGSGGYLAHAYPPRDGRLHMDDDEQWSSSLFGDYNLRQVATHEVGHIIGLGHSKEREAVMFPLFIQRYDFSLQADDIAGAVFLYGPKQANNTQPPRTSPPGREYWWN